MDFVPPPPMWKAMTSAPPTLGLLLASRIAWRSEPVPLSLVFTTVKVERRRRSSRISTKGRDSRGRIERVLLDSLFREVGNQSDAIARFLIRAMGSRLRDWRTAKGEGALRDS